jgi:hypothetical protein
MLEIAALSKWLVKCGTLLLGDADNNSTFNGFRLLSKTKTN